MLKLAGCSNTYASVKGTVKKMSVGYRSKVYLYDHATNKIFKTMSDVNGEYEFTALPKGQFFSLFARDIRSKFNAVIQDNVVPK